MKAALFDLDGVLIDTEGIYSTFWVQNGKKFGVQRPDFADIIKGTTLKQILDGYFAPSLHGEIVETLLEFEKNMRYEIFPGVMDFLNELKHNNIATAIVTSSSDDKMERLWAQHPQLKKMFDAVITDSMITKSKPDPEPYLVAAQMVGCPSNDCVVFEDSYNGIESGRRAGAKVVGVATTNPAETLIDKANMVISTFVGLTVDELFTL